MSCETLKPAALAEAAEVAATTTPQNSPTEKWLSPFRFSLLVGLLLFAAYPDVLTGSRAFVFRDFGLYGYHLITADVEATQPSLIVVAQTFYDPWKAYVDRVPAVLWQANLASQALEVPAGRHKVTLTYEDRVFRLGGVLSYHICGNWHSLVLKPEPM